MAGDQSAGHPASYSAAADGRIVVQVRQIIRDLPGAVVSDAPIRHVFRLECGRIAAMEIQPVN